MNSKTLRKPTDKASKRPAVKRSKPDRLPTAKPKQDAPRGHLSAGDKATLSDLETIRAIEEAGNAIIKRSFPNWNKTVNETARTGANCFATTIETSNETK